MRSFIVSYVDATEEKTSPTFASLSPSAMVWKPKWVVLSDGFEDGVCWGFRDDAMNVRRWHDLQNHCVEGDVRRRRFDDREAKVAMLCGFA